MVIRGTGLYSGSIVDFATQNAAGNSPVDPRAPAGPARMVLDVHDEPDRGRKRGIRDELPAIAAKW
jgi:hypothetical protein